MSLHSVGGCLMMYNIRIYTNYPAACTSAHNATKRGQELGLYTV